VVLVRQLAVRNKWLLLRLLLRRATSLPRL